jgi:glucosamine--fructose-6-phosphate aminotransferase (isomerizing)
MTAKTAGAAPRKRTRRSGVATLTVERPRVLDDIAEQAAVLAGFAEANANELIAARQLIRGRRAVRIAGIGSSRHAAGIGALALETEAGIITTVLDAPGAGVDRPHLRCDDVLIVVSQSGETDALVALAEVAQRDRVPVIAVLNSTASRLALLADVVLDCGAGAERVVAATKSFSAQVLALRLIAGPVAPQSLRWLVDRVDTISASPMDGLLPVNEPRVIVSGGFAAQWVADEIALKFAEIAGISCAAESIVDYLHGPVATGDPAIAFIRAEANAAALRTHEHVHVVDADWSGTEDRCLDTLATVILGQRLAVDWASRHGADPDAARGLSKVTRTR